MKDLEIAMNEVDYKVVKFVCCLFVGMFIAGSAVYYIKQNQEADLNCYRIVTEASKLPGIRDTVKRATADGKITYRECSEVADAQENLFKEVEMVLTKVEIESK